MYEARAHTQQFADLAPPHFCTGLTCCRRATLAKILCCSPINAPSPAGLSVRTALPRPGADRSNPEKCEMMRNGLLGIDRAASAEALKLQLDEFPSHG